LQLQVHILVPTRSRAYPPPFKEPRMPGVERLEAALPILPRCDSSAQRPAGGRRAAPCLPRCFAWARLAATVCSGASMILAA
jgi:hypothetical protein